MRSFQTGLPVEGVLEELSLALQKKDLVLLSAEPGAGKSTLVPPFLMEEDFLKGKKILMLEPRRIAASGAAIRIAYLLGESCGERAGFRTRYENVVSPRTRIEVITEGILTRMIQSDPELADVGLIIFDEFHERNLQGDLGLALALDVQSAYREDLKILIMSATLDTEKIKTFCGDPDLPVIHCTGKVFPVETLYRPPEEEGMALEKSVSSAVVYALTHQEGDVLVFLPGEGEIRRALAQLEKTYPDAEAKKLLFLPLYGSLPEKDTWAALDAAPEGWRKVIVSTPVAESSVTIPGVRCVIDSGWRRTPVYSPASGMDHLQTVRISLASAEQRRGRAGRTGPGLCIRLWEKVQEKGFAPFSPPEILEADLTSLALELSQWGVSPKTVHTLHFPDEPPEVRLLHAYELLRDLGAVEGENCTLTAHGKILLKYPMHPRLGHMISRSESLNAHTLGCALAVILSERDFLYDMPSSDLLERLMYLCKDASYRSGVPDKNTLSRIRNAFSRLTRRELLERDLDLYGVLTAFAYPDRIARVRGNHSNEYILANGTMARLRKEDDMSKHVFLCIPGAEGGGTLPTIFASCALTVQQIRAYFSEQIRSVVTAEWNAESASLVVRREELLGCVALSGTTLPSSTSELDLEERKKVLLTALCRIPLPWSEKERSLMARISFLHKVMPEDFPDVSENYIAEHLEEILGPFLTAKHNSAASLQGQVLADAFYNFVGMDKILLADKLAPERIEVPSGSRIRVDYTADPPRLPVRLQEVFGMTRTPMLAGGKVPLVMELLSPAMRPVQITSDLANFWKDSYFLVRKEMRGRYPKHDWPENPLEVPAHRGVKRKEGAK